jgi:hypothetical protein
MDHQPFANRPALMRALIQIGMNRAVGAKDADGVSAVVEDFPLSLLEVGGAGNKQLGH